MNQNLQPDSRSVAFFDFDGTLTTRDSMMPFLRYVVGTASYYTKLALMSPVLAAYFVKLLRNDAAKQIVLKQYLAGYHIDDLFKLGERFSADIIPTMLRPEGMERLTWHQEQGHECVLISASMDIYLNAWATRHNFSEAICTSLSTDGQGYIQGSLAGPNCYGLEKKIRIQRKIASREPGMTYAYGDSDGDTEMLTAVEKGFFFNKKANRFDLFQR